MEIAPGTFIRASSNFESDVSGDLNLIVGDVVKVTSVVNDDWLEGSFGDDTGIFPRSHCVILELIPSSDPFGVALYSHEAHLHDELSFEAGDQIFFTSRVNPEWYNGTCQGRSGMFPIGYVSIVHDLLVIPARPPVQPAAPVRSPEPEISTPERPRSLDASTVANLRTKSLSKRNTVHPSDNVDTVEPTPDSPKRPPSLQPPNFPPPPPPPQLTPITDTYSAKTTSPQRPPSISRSSLPSRPAPGTPDSGTKSAHGETSEHMENNVDELKVPSRPPPLEADTVVVLRERSRSHGKRRLSIDKSPSRPPSTYMAKPSLEISGPLPLQSDQDNLNDEPSNTEEGTPSSPGFTRVSHPGLTDWNVVDEGPMYIEDSTYDEEQEKEEAEYANAADIQAVEEEYKTTAIEDATLKKMSKSIADKEKMLAIEQESKIQTEDLLAQQFSGKKIDKENVEVLRSLLNAHNEKISTLVNSIDSMKSKARTLKSPSQKSDKLDGIEKRDKVVIELIETEESNLKQLKLCISGFLQTLRNDTTHAMDIDMMFLNIEKLAEVADKLLMMLKGQQTLMSHEQMIGRCFTHLEEDLHREYTFYLENQASVMDLIAQYQKDKINKDLLDSCLQKIRVETTCWDLQSFLIRPVQRIMKYPLFLRDILVNTPAHWQDRPYLVSATEIVDNIVVFANENKRKDELIKRYNEEVTESSLLPKLTLHSLKKKSKRLTTTLTHSLNITSSVVDDSTFGKLSEKFASLVLIIKTLIREATNFTDLLKKVQAEMDDLCANIHNFYDNLETQKNVFLYHGAALKIAQNFTPRFIKDLEGGPLGTLSDLITVFTAPQYFIDKRNSKILDYDNLCGEGSLATENFRIARGEFEALNKQLLDDLPILIHEGAEVVKKSSYSVLALFCQYSHACHDEFRRALDKMSLELEEPPDSIHLYHMDRMKTCCATLLTISSFDKEVTQAIVLGSTVKPTTSKFYEAETCEEDQQASYDVGRWLENQPDVITGLSSDENEADAADDVFEKPGMIENVQTGTNCRILYDFAATSDSMLNVKTDDTVTLLSDCLISDTWAYVKCGEVKGYVPKSYLTLSGTLKNKPAPLPPSKANQDKGKSIKRRAPPAPKRAQSEVSLPTYREPVPSNVSLPAPKEPVQITPPVPEPVSRPAPPPPKRGPEVSLPLHRELAPVLDPEPQPSPQIPAYTTVAKSTASPAPPPPARVDLVVRPISDNKTTRTQPKRHAPPPPMSRRNTAPVLIHKGQNLDQISNLTDTSDSSGGGMLTTLPEHQTEVIEEKPRDTIQDRDILDLSSNLDDFDLLGGPSPSSAVEQDGGNQSFSDHIYQSLDQTISPQPVSNNKPLLIPVPIPLKSKSLSPEPYYEVIDSETSSEYESLPPPHDVITPPVEVPSFSVESFPVLQDEIIVPEAAPEAAPEATPEVAPDAAPRVGPDAAPDAAPEAAPDIAPQPTETPSAETLIQTNVRIDSMQPKEDSQPTNTHIPEPCTIAPTKASSRSNSVSSGPHRPALTDYAARSASISMPLSGITRKSGKVPDSATPPKTGAQLKSGPVVPNSPVPKQPSKNKETKSSPMFDECPMEMSAVRKKETPTNYEAQYNYRARSPAELSLSVRQVVSLVDSSDKDWWFVKAGRRQGFVPSNFLKVKS